MTIKMNDGNFYDGDASELTLDISAPEISDLIQVQKQQINGIMFTLFLVAQAHSLLLRL